MRTGGQDDNCRGSAWIILHSKTEYFLSPILDYCYRHIGEKVIAAEWMYHPYHFEMYQS